MRFRVVAAALLVALFSISLSAEAYAQTSAAGAVSKQLVKRIVVPLTFLMAAVDSANAYEKHCSHMLGTEAMACTAEAFTRGELEELKALGHDVADVWVYVVVPNAVEFWDENGDEIVEGMEKAADLAADAAIAAGDAVVEYTPLALDWFASQFD